jgi:alkanesulfonate monooxygenase SsuD/methylene tetrahydromethanopterin reductase-like flavin-dependent oxidoreductase (luciferase family)
MSSDMMRASREGTLKIGVSTRVSSQSLDVALVAQKAESLGFGSLWLPEHGVMPYVST